MESPYATSYVRIKVTYLLSYTVSGVWRIILSIFAVEGRVPLFKAFGVNP